MPNCNCHPPFPRPEPFSPLPRPGRVPDWGDWLRKHLEVKADKVPSLAGNLAALTQGGNLADSGVKPSDFATAAQGAKADTAVQPAAIAGFVDGAEYDAAYGNPPKPTILLKHGDEVVATVDAAAFIIDGMVSNVEIKNGNLVITFNTDAGQEPISISLTDIFNPNNYYTAGDVDSKFVAKESGKGLSTNDYTTAEKGKVANLPDFVPVEYIEGTGTQWIDTGLDYFADFEVGLRMRSSVPNVTLCAGTARLERKSAAAPNWEVKNTNTAGDKVDTFARITDLHTVAWRDGAISADGRTVGNLANQFVSGRLRMFTPDGAAAYPAMIYSCKLYDSDGELVRDFIPVRKDGVGGLYDRVTETFFGNQGTGSFGFGDDLPLPSDDTPKMDGTASPGTSQTYSRSDHVHPSDNSRRPVETDRGIFDVLPLNRETVNILAAKKQHTLRDSSRSRRYVTPFVVAHFSDLHGDAVNLRRYLDYCDRFNNYIDARLNTGDSILNTLSDDFTYYYATPGADTVMMSLGNHDAHATSSSDWWSGLTRQQAYERYIEPFVETCGVTAVENKCYYHKDFVQTGKDGSSNLSVTVRLVVIDATVMDADQLAWLEARLDEAAQGGYHVVAAAHFALECTPLPTPFNYPVVSPLSGYYENGMYNTQYPDNLRAAFALVKDFKDGGGKFACWLVGHQHYDFAARLTDEATYGGQLVLGADTAKAWGYHVVNGEGVMDGVAGTATQDGFQIVSVDPVTERITVFKVGRKLSKSGKLHDHYSVGYGASNFGEIAPVNYANRAANPTAGNLAALDSDGNPTDSGKKPNDFQSALTAQQLSNIAAVSDALAFDATHSYAAGDPVVYNGTLYTFTAAHIGAWTGSDVSAVDIIARLAGKLDSTSAAPAWVSGTAYTANALVTYDGMMYRCRADTVSPHTATPDADTTHWESIPVSDLFLPLRGGAMGGSIYFGSPNRKRGIFYDGQFVYLSDSTLLGNKRADILDVIRTTLGESTLYAKPYDLGTPTVIDTASSETVYGETVYYGEATIADRTANVVQVIAATALDALHITFPAATSGKVRDFGLRVEIGTGSAALAAPALVLSSPTEETIELENADGTIPALADGTATAKGVTLLYFSETAPGVFVVKGEQVEEVA